MNKKAWTYLAVAAAVPLGYLAYRRFFGTKYVVVAAHNEHPKGEILRSASAKQVRESLVVPVHPDHDVPVQAQLNPQLADASEDVSFQNLSEFS